MNDSCYEGLNREYGNMQGSCCCNCEYHRPVYAHPWNEDPFSKGKISKIIGYGCTNPEFFPAITFFDEEHGLCEVWTKNTWKARLKEEEIQRSKELVWDIMTDGNKHGTQT